MKIDVPETLEAWNVRGAEYLPGRLGMEFLRVDADEVRGRVVLSRAVFAWNGFVHAGTIVSLADTCCGYGTICALPEGAAGFTTLNLASNHLSTAKDGAIVAVATPVHRGRSTQVWDATVSDEANGKLLAHFRCTQMILWPR